MTHDDAVSHVTGGGRPMGPGGELGGSSVLRTDFYKMRVCRAQQRNTQARWGAALWGNCLFTTGATVPFIILAKDQQ